MLKSPQFVGHTEVAPNMEMQKMVFILGKDGSDYYFHTFFQPSLIHIRALKENTEQCWKLAMDPFNLKIE